MSRVNDPHDWAKDLVSEALAVVKMTMEGTLQSAPDAEATVADRLKAAITILELAGVVNPFIEE